MANILVVSPLSSHPPQNGARRRIYAMLTALKRQGHKIHFVYTACEKVDLEANRALMAQDWDSVDVFNSGHEFIKTQGEDYGLDDWINPEVCGAIGGLAEKYDITHCLVNYVFQSRYFEFLPDHIFKILDAHDRLARRHIYTDMGIEPGFYYTTEAEEQRGLARSDVILSIQDNEVSYFQKSGKPVVVVGHMAPVASLEKRFTKFERLGYIGAYNKFNIHALEAFIPAFAEYSAQLEKPLTFSIAGNVAKYFGDKPEYQFDCVSYDGFVEDIGAYFESIDLYVNPTLMGTGLKIKSVEALSYGMPTVSTTTGWDGLLADPEMHAAPDVPVLIDIIEGIRIKGFDALTKMSNFAKASFAEYQLNLEQNLRNLFEKSQADSLAWASMHPHYIGNLQDQNPEFYTLDQPPLSQPAETRPVIAHVVNPVRMPKASDLYIAQPVAFRSMARARDASLSADVMLVSRRYEEDSGYLRDCFDIDLPLKRSAQDLSNIENPRKLPMLAEVFSLEGVPDAVTHVVYTNSDIGVQPHFYDFVAKRIEEGHDALVINRRTMPKHFTNAGELNELYTDFGKKHPGFDCFVVSRELLEQCRFDDTLVGVHLIGRVIFWNLIAHADKIGYFDDHHLTFHIGDDVPSKGRATLPYIRHNLEQGAQVARALQSNPGHFEDPKRIERFSRVLQVSPGEIQGQFDPATDPRNPLFLHSFFRTGSTYFFQKIRNQRGWTAYYEPFHEDLALFSSDKLDHFRQRHANSQFRHAEQGKPNPSNWLFAEFEPLMDDAIQGVHGYDRRMSYMNDYEGAADAVRAYVQGLIDTAPHENVFLQFNRTALRQEWMKGLFPDAAHVYLKRSLRDTWGSYLSFRSEAVYGFLRNNLAVLNFNANDPLMRALSMHLPVVDAPFVFFFHPHFSNVFHHYTLEQHYLIHATFWYAAVAQAESSSDLIIDLERISEDRLVRLETEATLASHRVMVSFDDIKQRQYNTQELLLSEKAMNRIEALARRIVNEANNVPNPVQAEEVAAPVVPMFSPPRTEELELHLQDAARKEADVLRAKLQPQRDKVIKHSKSVPALEVGKSYKISELFQNGALAFGFHHREKYHVWGSGAFAGVRFEVPETQDVRIELRIHIHPEMAARHQETFVYVNNVFDRKLRMGSTWEHHSVTIEREVLEECGGVVDICFVMPRLYKGKGKRSLSLCLSRITVEQAQPLSSGTQVRMQS